MIINLNDDMDKKLAELLQSGRMEELLAGVRQITFQISNHPEMLKKGAFFPSLDALMQEASLKLCPPYTYTPQKVAVYVLSEVYDVGGHTRVTEDTIRALPEYKHILILTDIIDNYHSGNLSLAPLKERFEKIGLEVIILKHGTLVNKAEQLLALIHTLAPEVLFMLAHEFDSVTNAAIGGQSAPKVIFQHHADLRPCLGVTRKDYIHMDMAQKCFDRCKTFAFTTPHYACLTTEDYGTVKLPDINGKLTGATCAHWSKYTGRKEFSYGEVLAALFAAGVDKIIHMGSMPEANMAEIRNDIIAKGQNPNCVVFTPNVASLAQSLISIAPHFYLTSHPLGGARANVEAMSTGLPFISPNPPGDPALELDVHLLGPALIIKSLDDAAGCIEKLRHDYKTLGAASRRYYDDHYSAHVFRKQLLDIIAAE